MYGQRKPLAERVLVPRRSRKQRTTLGTNSESLSGSTSVSAAASSVNLPATGTATLSPSVTPAQEDVNERNTLRETASNATMRARAMSDTTTSSSASAMSTPSATEGDTATEEDEVDTETETELEEVRSASPKSKHLTIGTGTSLGDMSGPAGVKVLVGDSERERAERMESERSRSPTSGHDLMNRYFRNDTIFLKNWDVFR